MAKGYLELYFCINQPKEKQKQKKNERLSHRHFFTKIIEFFAAQKFLLEEGLGGRESVATRN